MNILLVQLKRIGDLVLTTPAIAAVRKKFPEAHISLVVAPATRDLLPAIPGLGRTFVASGQVRDAGAWLALARAKFDICLDFTHSDRSALATVVSRARQRITFRQVRAQSKLRALSYNALVDASLRYLHTVDYYLALLEPLGIRDPAPPALRLELPATALAEADRVLAQASVRGDFVLVHPGSARAEKYWTAEGWRNVIAFAAAAGWPVILTAGNSAPEQSHIAEIKRGAGVIDLSGRLNLLTLAALIAKARLLVTVDSAPMHLAAATQTPQVALFGPTNPLHWRPRFSPAIVLQAGAAAPLREFSADQTPAAMNLISTEQVIDGMKALLAAPRGALV